MALGWVHALTLCASLTTGGLRQDTSQVQQIRIPLKHTGIDRMYAALAGRTGKILGSLPTGIAEVKPDPRNNELLVTGTAEGVKELYEIVRLLDVTPRRLRLKARVFRLRAQNGRQQRELLLETTAVTTNNSPLSLSVGDEAWDQTATVVPKINGDGSITIRADFALAVGGDVKVLPAPVSQKLAAGKVFFAFYSDSPVAHAVGDGGIEVGVATPGRALYRIEVQILEVLPDPPSKK